MVILNKKSYKSGNSVIVTVGKKLLGKNLIITDEFSERDLIQFRHLRDFFISCNEIGAACSPSIKEINK